jgi:hypothetical protein
VRKWEGHCASPRCWHCCRVTPSAVYPVRLWFAGAKRQAVPDLHHGHLFLLQSHTIPSPGSPFCWCLQESTDELYLIPAIDMLNHSTQPSLRNTSLALCHGEVEVTLSDGLKKSFTNFFSMRAGGFGGGGACTDRGGQGVVWRCGELWWSKHVY